MKSPVEGLLPQEEGGEEFLFSPQEGFRQVRCCFPCLKQTTHCLVHLSQTNCVCLLSCSELSWVLLSAPQWGLIRPGTVLCFMLSVFRWVILSCFKAETKLITRWCCMFRQHWYEYGIILLLLLSDTFPVWVYSNWGKPDILLITTQNCISACLNEPQQSEVISGATTFLSIFNLVGFLQRGTKLQRVSWMLNRLYFWWVRNGRWEFLSYTCDVLG